mgnify:CR=1 FL=1
MQKPRKRFLSAIVAVAMCLSQFAPVTAYAVESASGITQSEEAPKETDATQHYDNKLRLFRYYSRAEKRCYRHSKFRVQRHFCDERCFF